MNGKLPDYMQTQYEGKTNQASDDEDLGYCASRAAAMLYHALGVKRTGKKDRVFEYSHMATSYEGDNERLDLVFAGEEKWIVVVHGRGLLKLLYFIKERRIDWVREASRDVGQDEPGKPFISKIEITKVDDDKN